MENRPKLLHLIENRHNGCLLILQGLVYKIQITVFRHYNGKILVLFKYDIFKASSGRKFLESRMFLKTR